MLITKVFARGLGLSDDFIKSTFNPPFFNMTLWHYPPNPCYNESWGVGPHTDYQAVTFLLQDNVGGLELKKLDGLWVDVPPKEGKFVSHEYDSTTYINIVD
jgi:isopenicillin N synthase-like dioxygenase